MTDQPNDINQSIQELRTEIETLNRQRFFSAQNSWFSLAWFNFLRGMFFGLGSVVGATVLVYVLIQMLSQINFLPIIGDWASEIIKIIGTNPK